MSATVPDDVHGKTSKTILQNYFRSNEKGIRMNKLLLKNVALALAALVAATPAQAACRFTSTITVPPNPATEKTSKHAYGLKDGSRMFLGQFFIDADGAPRAYHADDAVAMDNLINAGEPGNWWALATDAKDCGRTGKPIVQSTDDPAPGYYVVMTSMSDPAIEDCRRQGKYVDPEKIPYVALSQKIRPFDYENNEGALALIVNLRTGKRAFAVFADQAPDYGFGEGSMVLGKALGLDPDPKSGGTDARENMFVIFPDELGFTRDVGKITGAAQAAFQKWGGNTKLEDCLKLLKKSRK